MTTDITGLVALLTVSSIAGVAVNILILCAVGRLRSMLLAEVDTFIKSFLEAEAESAATTERLWADARRQTEERRAREGRKEVNHEA